MRCKRDDVELVTAGIDNIVRWIRRWQHGEFDTVEPTATAADAYNSALSAAMPGTVWTTGCDSWYLDKNGLPGVWPHTPAKHRTMLAKPHPEDYLLHAAAPLGSTQ